MLRQFLADVQAVVMVVVVCLFVRPPVRLSVTNVLWLSRAR